MNDRASRVEKLAVCALEVPPERRDNFVQQECAGDEELRREVEAWLQDHERAGLFLETPVLAPDRPTDSEPGPQGTESTPLRIAGYNLLEELGRGGMGVVYLAEQNRPRRKVAVKLIALDFVARTSRLRFEQEAEILGRLQHPGIAQVFEAGTAALNGREQPFIAMELVIGPKITDHVKVLSTSARVELMVRVCLAVEYAHTRGIVHRDLKPGNILVDSLGQPKILDFGIARAINRDAQISSMRTDVGQMIGTLAYMSPEQASGDPRLVDARSDVYALGMLLYEVLAGHPPYDLTNIPIPEAARRIADQDVPSLSRSDPRFRGDLETIVERALEKDPARRYASAANLAADLRHYLSDEPIVARPASTLYQLRKFTKRNKALVFGVVATMLTLAGGIIGIGVFAARLAHQRDKTEGVAVDLQRTLHAVRKLLAGPDPEHASASNLLERLRDDERPNHGGRIVTLILDPLTKNRPLVFLNDDGARTAELKVTATPPAGLYAPESVEEQFIVTGAILIDAIAQSPGRKLVVMLQSKRNQSHTLLRLYDLDLNLLASMWHNDRLHNVVWSPLSQQLLVTVDISNLPECIPEAAGYDSLGCPTQQLQPSVVIAMSLSGMKGTLTPISGTSIECAQTLWAMVRIPDETANIGRRWFSQMLKLQPPDAPRVDAVGQLEFLTAHLPEFGTVDETPIRHYSAHIASDGRLLEPVELDLNPPEPPVPVHLLTFDLARAFGGSERAAPLLRKLGTVDAVRRRLHDTPELTQDEIDATVRSAEAMTSSWRWLGEEGKKLAMADGATKEELSIALTWAQERVRLHNSRCPRPESCQPGWYAMNTLAVIRSKGGLFQDSLASLDECESIWNADGKLPIEGHAVDAGWRAVNLARLGRHDEAARTLAELRDLMREPGIGSKSECQIVLDEAQRLVDDSAARSK